MGHMKLVMNTDPRWLLAAGTLHPRRSPDAPRPAAASAEPGRKLRVGWFPPEPVQSRRHPAAPWLTWRRCVDAVGRREGIWDRKRVPFGVSAPV